FAEVDAFQPEEYDTAEKIFDAIENEMGWRGRRSDEFIAQAVALVYNGNGGHPISDSVVQWLKRRLG
ncbi:MAG: hypothetical protein RR337_10900, partial [Clostridia bacterium]